MSLAIILTVLLQGLCFSRMFNYPATPFDITFSTNVASFPTIYHVSSSDDTIHLLLRNDPSLLLPNGFMFWSTSEPFVGGNSVYRNRLSMVNQAANIVRYENNDCDNTLGGGRLYSTDAYSYYAYTMNFPIHAYCFRYYGGSEGEYFWQCYANKEKSLDPGIVTRYLPPFSYAPDPKGNYSGYCRQSGIWSYSSSFFIRVRYTSDSLDGECEPASPTSCQICAWPYLSVPDSLGCGCVVDPTKLMSQDRLKIIAYAYCNGTTDSMANTYYLDYSRSNFDPSLGAIRAACSSPASGKTVYMPTNTCPMGSYVPLDPFDSTLADSLDPDHQTNRGAPPNDVSDSAARNRLDSILAWSARGDTGTHNRLDTIIDLLRNQTGGSGGYDSTLAPKLDSLRYFLDTVGGSSYDSAKSRLQYVFDSLNSDTLQYQPYIDSIMSNINTHASRGDTSIANGITVDSILNFCVTFNDSTHCFSDTSIYPYMVASVKWIRRLCLVIWAFLCAGIFFSIATGGIKND